MSQYLTTAASTFFSGGTIDSVSYFLQGASATTFSAGTYYGDGSNLTGVIFTGGTVSGPTIFQDGLTSNTISATTISGNTIISGSTDLYDIFVTNDSTDVVRVQPGTNISTGGTQLAPTINLTSDVNTQGLTAVTLSATTLYGDGSNLTGLVSTFTGGSINELTVSGITSLQSANTTDITVSNNATVNGSIYSVGAITGASLTIANNITGGGLLITGNTYVGTLLTASTLSVANDVDIGGNMSSNTVYTGTIYSGGTDLSDLMNRNTTFGVGGVGAIQVSDGQDALSAYTDVGGNIFACFPTVIGDTGSTVFTVTIPQIIFNTTANDGFAAYSNFSGGGLSFFLSQENAFNTADNGSLVGYTSGGNQYSIVGSGNMEFFGIPGMSSGHIFSDEDENTVATNVMWNAPGGTMNRTSIADLTSGSRTECAFNLHGLRIYPSANTRSSVAFAIAPAMQLTAGTNNTTRLMAIYADGSIDASAGLSGTTISAGTYHGDGSNLTGLVSTFTGGSINELTVSGATSFQGLNAGSGSTLFSASPGYPDFLKTSATTAGATSTLEISNDLFGIFGQTGFASVSGIGMAHKISEKEWFFVKAADDTDVGGNKLASLGYVELTTGAEAYLEAWSDRIRGNVINTEITADTRTGFVVTDPGGMQIYGKDSSDSAFALRVSDGNSTDAAGNVLFSIRNDGAVIALGGFSALTLSATTYYGLPVSTAIQPGLNIVTGGTQAEPVVSLSGNVTVQGFTSTTISATTYQGLPVEVHTAVQGGTNISTGGTQSVPSVKLDSNIWLNTVTAVTISASTYQGLPVEAHTAVQGGTNISTGGTQLAPSVKLDADIWLNTVTAVTISASTYQGLPVEVHTAVQGGTNISTGGTQLAPSVKLDTDIWLNTVTAVTISASTYQGLPVEVHTAVQGGTNISTGGTQLAPSVKLDTDIWLNTVTAVTISASTYQGLPVEVHTAVQGGTNISTGGTQLAPSVKLDSNIWLNTVTAVTISASTYQGLPVDVHTAVQPGLNIVTGGTQLAPIVSLSGNVTVQGLTAVTLSATTILTNPSTNNTAVSILAIDSNGIVRVRESSTIGTTVTATTYDDFWVDSSAMIPLTTSGATYNLEEYGNNLVEVDHLLFSGSNTPGAQFKIQFPSSWDRTDITANVYWDASTGATVGDGVVWGMSAVSLKDNELVDTAFGSETEASDTVLTSDTTHISSAITVTIAGSPQNTDMMLWRLRRLTSNANDDMTEQAKLLGVRLQYHKHIIIANPNNIVNIGAAYTASTADYTMNCTGGTFSVFLPTAVGNDSKIFNVKNGGAGTITIDPDGSETIDDSSAITISVQYDNKTVQSDGSNWITL